MTTTLYEGTKRVHAKPMNRGDYNSYRGWEVPADENPADEGYLVEYVDGGRGNDSRHAGYISWSPKDVFERSYKEIKTVPGLAPHQQRVVDEHADLLERLRKLRAFIGDAKGPFRQLDDAERHRLMHQEDVMTELATVLAERVAAFQPAPVGHDSLERGMERAHKIQDEALLAGATGREDMRLLCGAATFTVPIKQEIQAKAGSEPLARHPLFTNDH